MKYFLSYFFICIIPLCDQQSDVWGQQNNLYPELYTGYFYNLASVNPAYIPSDHKINLIASHKNRTGPFTKIASYSFTAEKAFWKENRTAHVARVLLSSEKEGPFIHKPRVYGNYAYMLSFTEDATLSAGISLGMAQVAFSAPTATGSGSGIFPDGAIGLLFKMRSIRAGVSSMQIFNSGTRIINAPFQLRRFYTFYLSIEKELSPDWTIKGYSLWRMLPQANDNGDLAVALDFKNFFTSGFSLKNIGGLALFASFKAPIGNNELLINFIYNTPILSSRNNFLNSFEITSGYGISPLQTE